ncbi:MAG: hypothetical protein A2381_12970 [Bdellovibrionales bacterium RIFOXYB1_FULL_37_110]|nr:MAG: hypothetical protein A2181_02295 [Bdellovibrionales bacterium RIFOXYA1_FULL_38_20]OFZ51619.1 MAG: hypothetical protein A2417_12630 [Bdellovibrionales bacterium RIFOXYC1_FULL_37_79]OFZ60446.1 MAG: hypothetical protein A2381_12970 [Bdellovibrionales bacterium RIFOXYB1_FULL_37_110]OFZ65019.1 MAG: hypothetical protein A2577_09235 [Bdellovibrionales bacterium RIFOXYD1_FULL_36_51]
MISLLKKMEPTIDLDAYQSLYEHALTGIIFFDPSGVILQVNPRACEIMGQKKEDMIFKTLNEFTHINDQGIDAEIFLKLQRRELNSYITERKLIKGFSQVIHGKISYSRIDDVLGGLKYVVGFLEDVSQQVQMENDKENMMRKLFQSSKLASLGQLASGVGHEINNPLAIINGHIELLELKIKKDEYSKMDMLNHIQKQKIAVSRIANVVNGLRSYSCENDVEVVKIDMHEVIDTVLDMLYAVFEKANVHIIKEYSKGNFWVLGNFNKFEQVITHLLTNAKDATENKKRRVIVIKTMVDNDVGVIKIADNGTGMTKEVQEKVFDTFFTTKEVGKGCGLGLGIVKNIVEASGGSIDLISQLQMGATICIKLPLLKISFESLLKIVKPRMKGRVLVVDDEFEIRNYLGDQLSNMGFEVDIAEDGQAGFDLVLKHSYKYVFADLLMPIMDGEEMIKKIKKLPNFDGKIFIITGLVERIGSEISMFSDGCLMKPFDHPKIFNLLAKFEKK